MIKIEWKNLIKTYMIMIGMTVAVVLIMFFFVSFILWKSPILLIKTSNQNANFINIGIFLRTFTIIYIVIGLSIHGDIFDD